jgi:hypothetical protein
MMKEESARTVYIMMIIFFNFILNFFIFIFSIQFQNGSVVMFGRAASYRFVDIPTDGRYNLALSQSQLDSAYLYEK